MRIPMFNTSLKPGPLLQALPILALHAWQYCNCSTGMAMPMPMPMPMPIHAIHGNERPWTMLALLLIAINNAAVTTRQNLLQIYQKYLLFTYLYNKIQIINCTTY